MNPSLTQEKHYGLSLPHMGGDELKYVSEAFLQNWIAPSGPQLDAFEKEFCSLIGSQNACALNSGTAALHLALIIGGVNASHEVITSPFTFAATVNPIIYQGAKPVFIDIDPDTWHLDTQLLVNFLNQRKKNNQIPKAMIIPHIYGQMADILPLKSICQKYNIFLIEDAAEALGAYYTDQSAGTFGDIGIFSFNGNKVITTSAGGMFISDNKDFVDNAYHLASQARIPGPRYTHDAIGYNYRMSNILAAIGLGQLNTLKQKVIKKNAIYNTYFSQLKDLPGLKFMPIINNVRPAHWLTCFTINNKQNINSIPKIITEFKKNNIEYRYLWKPLHTQRPYQYYEYFGNNTAQSIYNHGLCLPSSTQLTLEDISEISHIITKNWMY